MFIASRYPYVLIRGLCCFSPCSVCCLTGKTLVKLILVSSRGWNSVLSSPDVHKVIL